MKTRESARLAFPAETSPLPEGAIIWAVDPYEVAVRPDSASLAILGRSAARSGKPPQPVYVRGNAEQHEAALEVTRTYLQTFTDVGLGEGAVLASGEISRRAYANTLIGAAKAIHSPLIAVSSHCRSGPRRWLLGSFAEQLVESSPVPLLFLSHRERLSAPNEKGLALFATNFSARSHLAFGTFLRQQADAGLDVILYHDVLLALPLAPEGGFTGGPPDYSAEQTKWALEQGAQWKDEARRLGIAVRLRIDDGGLDVAADILETARQEGVDLIALAASGGMLSRVLFGSAARDVCRSNLCPVWLYGPGVE